MPRIAWWESLIIKKLLPITLLILPSLFNKEPALHIQTLCLTQTQRIHMLRFKI